MDYRIIEGDFGPFKWEDKALYESVCRYGGEPFRHMLKIKVRDEGGWSFDEFPTTVAGMIKWLEDAKNDAPEDKRADLRFTLAHEDYNEGCSSELSVWYERPETDAEMTKRVNEYIAYVRKSEAREREKYEALKAKYG